MKRKPTMIEQMILLALFSAGEKLVESPDLVALVQLINRRYNMEYTVETSNVRATLLVMERGHWIEAKAVSKDVIGYTLLPSGLRQVEQVYQRSPVFSRQFMNVAGAINSKFKAEVKQGT